MKGIKTGGVPVGTRCAKNSVILLINLYIIKANQSGRAKDKVIAKWLVAVNVKDTNPKVLLQRIKKKSLIKIIMLDFFLFKRTENSFFMFDEIKEKIENLGDDKTQ